MAEHSYKNMLHMLPYRDQPACENKQCEVLRQELAALKATPKPRYRLEWRNFDGITGATVSVVFSVVMLIGAMSAYFLATPEPSTTTLMIAWPVVPFIFMLHMLKIVKR